MGGRAQGGCGERGHLGHLMPRQRSLEVRHGVVNEVREFGPGGHDEPLLCCLGDAGQLQLGLDFTVVWKSSLQLQRGGEKDV